MIECTHSNPKFIKGLGYIECQGCGANLGEPKDATSERLRVFKKIEKILRLLPKEERRIVVATFWELYK